MAILLTCKDVRVEFPTKEVLSGVTLGVETGDRIGIVGRNGDGKSTLLRAIAGALAPDSGTVIAGAGLRIGMLAQRDGFSPDDTVRMVLSQVETDAYTWEADRAARDVVGALLSGVDLDARIGDLSGGQRRRVDLARLLMGRWDVLLLDEPTNHLDIRAIDWLAGHLRTRWPSGQGALLVVTHDRWFLDAVCERMWEVHDGAVDPFEGGYSAYLMQRLERDRLEAKAKQKRENQLRRELAWLSRGAQARRRKPRFHVEAAQALIADVPPLRNPIELRAMAIARLGKQVVELNDACVDLGGRRVIADLTWIVGPGDRIGILGENGAGKTTLLNLLGGRLRPTLGRIRIGRTVQCATLSQNLDELAPFEDDVVRVLLSRYKTYYQVEGRKLSPTAMLERMGFARDELNARVKDLSGGQRRRLALLLTLLEEPNMLILDEPGNDLDTDMLAVTEDLLDHWPGTLVVVSHDRYFIERVCDNLYAVVDGRVRHVPAGVDEYLRLLSEKPASAAPAQRPATPSRQAAPQPALGNAERHALKKQLQSTEKKMATQQRRLERAREALAQADPYDFEALGQAQAAIDAEARALSELEDAWLELSEKLA